MGEIVKFRKPDDIICEVFSVEEAVKKAKEIGYPISISSAFGLGWNNALVVRNEKELRIHFNQKLIESLVGKVGIIKVQKTCA